MRCLPTLFLLVAMGLAQDSEIEQLKDPSDRVRRNAAQALGRMGPAAKQAVPALIAALDDRNGIVRGAVILALGSIGDARAVAPLAERLGAPVARTRGLAARSLARIGTPALPALRKILREAEAAAARAAAADAFLDFVLRDLPLGEARSDLVAALKDPAGMVRVAAAGTLLAVEPGSAAAHTALGEALGAPQPDLAARAIHVAEVAKVRDVATIRMLGALLASSDQTLRWRAARALGRAGAAAIPVLADLDRAMRTSSYEVRTAVASALGRIGKPALPVLHGLLRAPDLDVTLEVAHALKSMPQAALAELIPLLAGDSSLLAARAARACTALGATAAPALLALRKLLSHKDLAVRCAAGRAVWILGGDAAAALPALAAALESRDPAVRKLAATTLGGLGRAALDAVPALERAARDSDKNVAGAATRALKRING